MTASLTLSLGSVVDHEQHLDKRSLAGLVTRWCG